MGRFENQGAAVLNESAIRQCGRLLLMRASKIPQEKKRKKKKKKKKKQAPLMVRYELLLIANARVPAPTVFDMLHSCVQRITAGGGAVLGLENLGVRALAQPKR
jgi:hypothetical protein